MSDVFISYANLDRRIAQALADALEALGWSVWWDREIPLGKAFDQVIEEELNAARCVIVLWSEASARSRWVKTEAAAAAERERLLPVLIEDVAIPFEFRRIQTAMLSGWTGDREHPEFQRVVDSIRGMLGEPPARKAAPAVAARKTTAPHRRLRNIIGAAAVAIAIALVGVAVVKTKSPPEDVAAPQPPASTQATVTTPAPPPQNASSPQTHSVPIPPVRAEAEAPPVPPPLTPVKGAFALKIGDRIEDGVPGQGAGHIEAPGSRDVYIFAAAAGQRVYFRMLGHTKDMGALEWKLRDPDGASVFETRLTYTEPGVQVLRKAGTYTMTVGSERDPAVGTYRLQLFNVPPPTHVPVRIGDMIRENEPAAGAGTIESPGAKDVYTFKAEAGQQVYFRMLEHSRGMGSIEWVLTDPDDAQVFASRLTYTEPGVQVLRKPGAYKMTVGSDRDPSVGTYRLRLFGVPAPQRYSIRIGDTIGENTPGPGAGTIETPGAKDVYTFSAQAGQRVYFRMLEHGKGMGKIEWKLVDPDGMAVFETRLTYSEPGVQVLRKAGTYTMTIGSDRDAATGPYRLQLTSAQ
jgi:hypothetical protein